MRDTVKPLRNCRQIMDGLTLLRSLEDRSAACVWFDAQYRQGLDKLQFGNEGARQKARAELPQMTDAQITAFIREIQRVLRPSGHLMMWLDKFALVSGGWQKWIPDITPLSEVDLFTWDKMRMGMGRRSRCQTEFLVVIQTGPRRAKGVWTDNGLADIWHEKPNRKRHPHAKPIELTKRIIKAVTKRGDLVVDPAAGGYGVLEACLATRREFIGCDLI